jgi:hypothetical protein
LEQIGVRVLLKLESGCQQKTECTKEGDPNRRNFVASIPSAASDTTEKNTGD